MPDFSSLHHQHFGIPVLDGNFRTILFAFLRCAIENGHHTIVGLLLECEELYVSAADRRLRTGLDEMYWPCPVISPKMISVFNKWESKLGQDCKNSCEVAKDNYI